MKKHMTELEIVLQNRERKKKLRSDILHDKLGIETTEQTMARLKKEREDAYAAVPIEKKQMFLDLFNGGYKLGQAAEKAGIDIIVAAEVILKNAVELIPTKVIK